MGGRGKDNEREGRDGGGPVGKGREGGRKGWEGEGRVGLGSTLHVLATRTRTHARTHACAPARIAHSHTNTITHPHTICTSPSPLSRCGGCGCLPPSHPLSRSPQFLWLSGILSGRRTGGVRSVARTKDRVDKSTQSLCARLEHTAFRWELAASEHASSEDRIITSHHQQTRANRMLKFGARSIPARMHARKREERQHARECMRVRVRACVSGHGAHIARTTAQVRA